MLLSRLSSLLMVQNAAARIFSSTRKFDHISPVLASLHWLPVQYRILVLLVFKALNGQAPSHISDIIQLTTHTHYGTEVCGQTTLTHSPVTLHTHR